MSSGDFEQGSPNPYRLFREIGEIKTRLDSVLANQEDFKKYTFEKVKKIDEAAGKLDERVGDLEGSRGLIMGICIAFSIFVTAIGHWLGDKFK